MAEQSGIIDSWDDQKGFGFIAVAPGKKVFFHISAVRGSHRPQQGEPVFFQLGTDKQGRTTATHVRSLRLIIPISESSVKAGKNTGFLRKAFPGLNYCCY